MPLEPWEHQRPFEAGTIIRAERMNDKLDGIAATLGAVTELLNTRVPTLPETYTGNINIQQNTINSLLMFDAAGDAALYPLDTFNVAVQQAVTARDEATTARDQAQTAQTAAANSAAQASNSETAAATSAGQASLHRADAETAATNAAGSASSAASSASSASTSQTAAGNSATDAAGSASAAASSATSANNAATAAASSASASGNSATAAAGSATTAGNSATVAGNAATAAMGYRDEAEGFKNQAQTLVESISLDWDSITGKPSTFTPSAHTHAWSEITGAPTTATRWPTWSEVTSKPSTFTPSAHDHVWADITGAPATATRWPTWSEVTSKPSTFTPSAHDHDRLFITDSRGAQRAPSYYDDRYTQWDFQNSSDTGAGGDSWHAIQTIAKWDSFNVAHKQEQLIFTGGTIKHRVATSDTAWGDWATLWTSGNDGSGSGLDADLLDGLHATSFMRANAANGYYGLATPDGSTSTWVRTTTLGMIPYQSGGSGSIGTSTWPFNAVYGITLFENGTALGSKYSAIGHGHSDYVVKSSNATLNSLISKDYIRVSSYDYTGHAGVLMDSDTDSGGRFYIVPSVNGEANPRWTDMFHYSANNGWAFDQGLRLAGRLMQGFAGGLQVNSDYGYAQIGPANASYCHISTDRAQFYTNKAIHVTNMMRIYNTETQVRQFGSRFSASASAQIEMAGGSGDTGVEVFQHLDSTADAMMTFHIVNNHAVNFGLDADRKRLMVGGFSDSTNKRDILTRAYYYFNGLSTTEYFSHIKIGNHARIVCHAPAGGRLFFNTASFAEGDVIEVQVVLTGGGQTVRLRPSGGDMLGPNGTTISSGTDLIVSSSCIVQIVKYNDTNLMFTKHNHS